MQILDQVIKNHVPIELVREVHFIHEDDIEIRMSMADLDPQTVAAFGKALYENLSDTVRIKLIVDVELLEKVVTDVVEPMLKNLPRRTY